MSLDLKAVEQKLVGLWNEAGEISRQAHALAGEITALHSVVEAARKEEEAMSDPTELTHENITAWAESGDELTLGAQSDEVTIFEKLCNRFDDDWYTGGIDDKFGGGCRIAAMRFQEARLLPETGVVDETTKFAMLAAFEEEWEPGMLFFPPWPIQTQVYGPHHPDLGELPGLSLGKDEKGRMSTFGGPQDYGDRELGQAYISDADSPAELIERRHRLVDMGVLMTEEQALAVVYGPKDRWKEMRGEPFFQGDLDQWPETRGVYKKNKADVSSMLNPDGYFIAMRFRRHANRFNSKSPKLILWCEKTQKAVCVLKADYGPHKDTGRYVDISPGAADALMLEPDDDKRLPTDSVVFVCWASDDTPLGPVEVQDVEMDDE